MLCLIEAITSNEKKLYLVLIPVEEQSALTAVKEFPK
jgi:hypothetical protein